MKSKGLTLTPEIEELYDEEVLGRYYQFLNEKNQAGGFFSKGDTERILERHLYESLILSYHVLQEGNVSRETRIADAGSGPGLPGYLFACLKESPALTLMDSSKRRLGLLDQFHSEQVHRKPVHFKYDRLEESKGNFDIVIMRALIPFPFNVEIISGLQKVGGKVFIAAGQELDFGDQTMEHLAKIGYVSRETLCPKEIQFLGSRFIYVLSRVRQAAKEYPRNWKQIKDHMGRWEKQ